MSKVAVLTDSNSGITQAQASEYGVHVLPMPFFINEELYYEDIDLTQEQFYEKLKGGCDISTSMPSLLSTTETWDKLLEEYDEVVYFPMSSGLSSSCETAIMLACDYDGKVQVVNNQRISVTLRQAVLDAKTLADQGKSAKEIRKYMEETKFDSSIYITVDTLKYLAKGGRLTPAVAALGTLLRIKPVLQIQGEKLDSFAKARTMKQAKSIMLEQMKKDFAERFQDPTGENMWLQVAYTEDREMAEEFKAEIQKEFPNHDIVVDPLSLSVSCHIGPGALAIACTKKLS